MCECTDNSLLARFIICVFACLLLIASPLSFAAIVGDSIASDAEVRYQSNGFTYSKFDGAFFILESADPSSNEIMKTDSSIDIWAPLNGSTTIPAGSQTFTTEPSQCQSPSGLKTTNTNIEYVNGSAIALPAALSAFNTTSFKGGNPLIIRVVDIDQNINPTIRDTITATLTTTPSGSDSETVVLIETDNASGEFVGLIQTTASLNNVSANNCLLSLGEASGLSVAYQDTNDTTDSANALAKFDPISRVFDSLSGAPLNGIEITLIDNATGLPATVYGDDTISIFPATILSGSTVSDSSGKMYKFPAGGYRFPYIPNGNYSIQITDSAKTDFPSSISDAELQALPLGPFLISGISRGEAFIIANQVFDADIPLDSKSDRILLDKTADKNEVGIGDFVSFNIAVNNAESFASNVTIVDTLPAGLRYVKGSLVVAGQPTLPANISNDGRTITIGLPNMIADERLTLDYVTQVAANAEGIITNQAIALHSELKSNIAKASITIKDDLFRHDARLFGRVILNDCDGNLNIDADGISGVRLYMEDGSYVVSDQQGEWHFEGIDPGTHVVQLDTTTIPDYLEVAECGERFFHAGQSYSQFVDLQPGSLWRADFYLQVKKPSLGEITQSFSNTIIPESVSGETNQRANITIMESSPVDEMIQYDIILESNGSGVSVTDVQEHITLPQGVVYQQGSLLIDGINVSVEPYVEVTNAGNTLRISLGDKPETWTQRIEFNGLITNTAVKGLLTANAELLYTPTLSSKYSQSDDRIISRSKLMSKASVELFIAPADGKADPKTAPRFANFSDLLTQVDKDNLEGAIQKLMGLKNLYISVNGHTDNIRISRRNRHIFADNQALSVARATSVAEYLSERLDLPFNNIKIIGSGASQPISTNAIASGRAKNRRVEIRVLNADANLTLITTDRVINTVKIGNLVGNIDASIPLDSLKANTKDYLLREAAVKSGNTSRQTYSAETAQYTGIDSGNTDTSKLKAGPVRPEINDIWFLDKSSETNWVWPVVEFFPAISATDISIQHPKNTSIRLTLNGVPVHGVYFEGLTRSKTTPVVVSEWRGIEIQDGRNLFVGEVLNRDDEVIELIEHTVHFAGSPANIEFLPELSYTYADGIKPAVIAVKFTDKDGSPVRPHSSGLVNVSSPFQLLQNNEYDFNPLSQNNKPLYRVEQGGIAFIELQPSSKSGEVQLSFEHANGVSDDLSVWIKPAERDWLLVGLGDLTVGLNNATKNSSTLSNGNVDDDIYHDGRIAFFAKGQIPGDFLLTAAYDSAKEQTTPFATLVQPGEYYTLYADASQQGNDSSSGDKLYLKVEKERFYALFGDLSTNLNKTQLGQYVRNLTGVQVAYLGDIFEVTAFASETDLGFARDEIQGNGTSGLYQLSNKFVVTNSDKIVIETRDRFQSNVIIDRQELTRYLDYSLDETSGTLYFKSPIANTDNNFNPIFIVASYETEQPDNGHAIGGRTGVKLLNNTVKAGITAVEEGSAALDSQLTAVDAEINLGNWTLKAEVAQTKRSTTTDLYSTKEATAKRAEAVYRSGDLEVNGYAQRIDDEFGLKQQSTSELDQQKVGIETSFYLGDSDQIRIDAFHQETLSTGLQRKQADADWTHKLTNISSITAGARTAVEESASGPRFVDELSLGANWAVLSQKLRLNAKATTDVSDRSEDNDRLRLGADYRWTNSLSTFLDYERSFNDNNLERTTIGLRTQPWEGGQAEQSIAQEQQDDGYRLYSVSGLSHDWQVDDHWLVSFGFNQSRNLDEQFPTETQSNTADFNAISAGWAYRADNLQWTNRAERRNARNSQTTLLNSSLFRPLSDSLAAGGSLNFYRQNAEQAENKNWDLTFDLALRPRHKDIAVLWQTRLVQENQNNSESSSETRKFINNVHANWMFSTYDQLAFQYGFKRVVNQYNNQDFAGTTNYLGAEWRHHLTQKWDVGVHGRELFADGLSEKNSYGLSVGYTPVKNLWASVGYNIEGFVDNDFSAANYTAQGVYLKLRFKADQETLSSLRQAFSW